MLCCFFFMLWRPPRSTRFLSTPIFWCGVVVADSLTQWHCDLLAGDLLRRGSAGSGKNSEWKQQVNPQQVVLHPLALGLPRWLNSGVEVLSGSFLLWEHSPVRYHKPDPSPFTCLARSCKQFASRVYFQRRRGGSGGDSLQASRQDGWG